MAAPPLRRLGVLAIVVLILLSAVSPAAASHLDNTVEINGPTPIQAPNGPNVTVTGRVNVSMTNAFPDANTVEVVSDEGNATFISNGPTNVTVAATEINGTWTNVSGLDVTANELYIDPGDKPAANVSGDTDTFSFNTSMTADDGQVDFVYSGTSGTSTITVRGLPSGVQLDAVDNDTGTVLATDTTSGTGAAKFSSMPNSQHNVVLQTSSGGGGGGGGTPATGDYDLPTAQHKRSLDVSGETGTPGGAVYADGGTKLFVAGGNGHTIYRYDLSTPYNVSTASFVHSVDLSPNVDGAWGVSFNGTGDRMYVADVGNGVVREYSLGSNFDLTTASLAVTVDVSPRDKNPNDIRLNPSGSKAFVVGGHNASIIEYSLGTNYDLSTASHSATVDVSSQESIPFGVAFNTSGSSMFVVGSNDAVYEYNLSSSFDVSSATFNRSLDLSSNVADGQGIDFNATGDQMIVTDDSGNEKVHQYRLVAHDSVLDDASASPTGDLQQAPQTLSIDLTDRDFDDVEGDSVDVEFFVDSSSVGTDTLTANGTASISHTFATGSHTWHAEATDADGGTVSSSTFSVSTPENVTIREEREPHSIINDRDVNVTISGSGGTVDRFTVTDGNISLAGLPSDENYAIVVNATGYHSRTILVEDIFSQQTVFILNTSRSSVTNTFVIDDRTGNFPPSETDLIIQKGINESLYDPSGSTSYQWFKVSGDRLGADQAHVVDLEEDGRYRLVVKNQDGDERVLGEYTAAASGTIELRIGTVSVSPDDSDTFAYDANFTTAGGSKFIKFQFNDPSMATSDLRLVIHEYGDESNEIENSTHAGPYGTFSFTEDLTAIGPEAENTTWVVEFTAQRNGQTISGSRVVGRTGIGETPPVSPMWMHVGSVGLLLLLASLVGGLVNPGAGAAAISATGGVLWYLELLPDEIGGGAIALGLLVSAGWILATRQGGAAA